MSEPLHRMEPTSRFSDRVGDYVRFRPDYPETAIDAIFEGLGYPRMLTIADVGAGTGIASRQLARRGARVLAIEPNADMLAALEPHESITPMHAKAEATGLADSSVDLIVCAQAFHWFDSEPTLREFRRIVRPLGRLAVMWNTRDVDDPVTTGYTDAIRSASEQHPAESRMDEARGFEDSPLFENLEVMEFAHEQRLTLDGLIGRARSASYCPKEGPRLDQLVRELTALHARHAGSDGLVAMRYRTRLFTLSPAGRA